MVTGVSRESSRAMVATKLIHQFGKGQIDAADLVKSMSCLFENDLSLELQYALVKRLMTELAEYNAKISNEFGTMLQTKWVADQCFATVVDMCNAIFATDADGVSTWGQVGVKLDDGSFKQLPVWIQGDLLVIYAEWGPEDLTLEERGQVIEETSAAMTEALHDAKVKVMHERDARNGYDGPMEGGN